MSSAKIVRRHAISPSGLAFAGRSGLASSRPERSSGVLPLSMLPDRGALTVRATVRRLRVLTTSWRIVGVSRVRHPTRVLICGMCPAIYFPGFRKSRLQTIRAPG